MMQRIFIDSSVLFTAANSAKGHSHDLMLTGAAGKLTLDKKHILGHPELEIYIDAPILTPAEAFVRLKEQP
jgi:hypothetical protein